jgi:hypothetical protein
MLRHSTVCPDHPGRTEGSYTVLLFKLQTPQGVVTRRIVRSNW